MDFSIPTGTVTVESPGGSLTIVGSYMGMKNDIDNQLEEYVADGGKSCAKMGFPELDYTMRLLPKDITMDIGKPSHQGVDITAPAEIYTGAFVVVGSRWVFEVIAGMGNSIAGCGKLVKQIQDGKWAPIQQGRTGVPLRWCLENKVRPRFIPPKDFAGWTSVITTAIGNMFLNTWSQEIVQVNEKTEIMRDAPDDGEWGLIDWVHEYYSIKVKKFADWPEVLSNFEMKILSVITQPAEFQYLGPKAPRCVLHNGGMIFMVGPAGAILVAHYDAETQTFCDAAPDRVPWKLQLGQGPVVLRDIRTYLYSEPEFSAMKAVLSICPNYRAVQIRADVEIPQQEDFPCMPLMGPFAEWTGKFNRLYRGEFYRYLQTGINRGGLDEGHRYVFMESSITYVWSIMTCRGMFWERDAISRLYYVRGNRDSFDFWPARDGNNDQEHIYRKWDRNRNTWKNVDWPERIVSDLTQPAAFRVETMKPEAIAAKFKDVKKRRNSSKSDGPKKIVHATK